MATNEINETMAGTARSARPRDEKRRGALPIAPTSHDKSTSAVPTRLMVISPRPAFLWMIFKIRHHPIADEVGDTGRCQPADAMGNAKRSIGRPRDHDQGSATEAFASLI
jgi:hypothetical protein